MIGVVMNWSLLFEAVCIALLLEGIPLFMVPKKMRASATILSQLDDFTLRIIGLVVMLLGVGLMVMVNA
jgi:uncharacterized protein YjeT (DUF2065 family)